MKFVLLGTSEFTLASARGVLSSGNEVAAVITLEKSLLPNNSADIPREAAKLGVPSYEIADVNGAEAIALLRSIGPDYLLVSWPKILKEEVLAVPRYFVIGSHPTAIPQNRGRHPLHWLIVLGIPQTALSFFRMDPGIDTGNILHTVPLEVKDDDEIQALNERLTAAAFTGVAELCALLKTNPALQGKVQNHAGANYWRARTPHDATIDFRLSVQQIDRLVRSFTLPYPCARILFENHSIPISKTRPASHRYEPDAVGRMEPGRVLSAAGRTIAVKAGDGIIECSSTEALPEELRRAKHIHPPTYYVAKWGTGIHFPGSTK